MLERTHLNILREIDRCGTLTEAANKLCLTQSALSHSIKKLEQQHNIDIWEKDGRNLRLTQAGEFLLGMANRLLPQMEYAEQRLTEFASGQRGTLRIGMECHPCQQWLLRTVSPYLNLWPQVDVDVRQKFQFGGIAALINYDIDILITPDPLQKEGLVFFPVFDYQLKLAVSTDHHLAKKDTVYPKDLVDEVLYSYPVPPERLDIYSQFLIPENCNPKHHKSIETTDIMLQMVAAGRGVSALPGWLLEEYQTRLPIALLQLGSKGIEKHIHVGVRSTDQDIAYVKSFLKQAKKSTKKAEPGASLVV